MFNFNRNSNLKPVVISALVTLSAAMIPMTSHAQDEEISFSIHATDLSTPAGVVRVYENFERRAERACDSNSRLNLKQKEIEKVCRTEILNDFVESVGNKSLTSYHSTMTSDR